MKYALMTVYQPDEAVLNNAASVAGQVDRLYLCDNSETSSAPAFAQLQMEKNVEYLWMGGNLGLSSAFNRVLKSRDIPWQESDYVLFFDQDSRIGPNHVAELTAQFEELSARGEPVGCIGPVYFNSSSGQTEMPRMKRPLSEHVYAVSSIITSSMLTTYGCLREIGFWNERLFLDMADWDLCWRIIQSGKTCCMTDAVVLQHRVGRGVKRFGPLRLRVGAPFREYYQIRDCLYLAGQEYTPAKYRLRFAAMILIRSPLHVLLLDHRGQRLRFILMGFRDFLKKRSGPIPQNEYAIPE